MTEILELIVRKTKELLADFTVGFMWLVVGWLFIMTMACTVFDGGKDAEKANQEFQKLPQEEKDTWFTPEKLKELTAMDFPPYHVTTYRMGFFPADGFSDTVKVKFIKPLPQRMIQQLNDSLRHSKKWVKKGKWYVLKYDGDDEYTSWGNAIFVSRDSLHYYRIAH